jgi:hypothetical protein
MAKIIETEDGTRMLVSDDAPDDITNESWFKPTPTMQTSINDLKAFMPTVDPASVFLCFEEETFPTIPVQANTFLIHDDKIKLAGAVLFSDYAWLLANIGVKLSHLEMRTEERSYRIAQGPLSITRFLGKDINASTVDVYVSFKRDI